MLWKSVYTRLKSAPNIRVQCKLDANYFLVINSIKGNHNSLVHKSDGNSEQILNCGSQWAHSWIPTASDGHRWARSDARLERRQRTTKAILYLHKPLVWISVTERWHSALVSHIQPFWLNIWLTVITSDSAFGQHWTHYYLTSCDLLWQSLVESQEKWAIISITA